MFNITLGLYIHEDDNGFFILALPLKSLYMYHDILILPAHHF